MEVTGGVPELSRRIVPIHCLSGASRRKALRQGSIQPFAHFIRLTHQCPIYRDFAGSPNVFPSEVLVPKGA